MSWLCWQYGRINIGLTKACGHSHPTPFKVKWYLNSIGLRANITTVDFDTNNDLLLAVRGHAGYFIVLPLV